VKRDYLMLHFRLKSMSTIDYCTVSGAAKTREQRRWPTAKQASKQPLCHSPGSMKPTTILWLSVLLISFGAKAAAFHRHLVPRNRTTRSEAATHVCPARFPPGLRLSNDDDNAEKREQQDGPFSSSSLSSSPFFPPPVGSLGPPEPLSSLPVGELVRAFRMRYSAEDGDPREEQNQPHDFMVERLAAEPPIFLLRGYLSEGECRAIQSEASSNRAMKDAETVTKGDRESRKRCQVAWLRTPMTRGLASAGANLFLAPGIVRSSSAATTASVEDLQVLRYQRLGEYVLHHDGAPRVLTVIYYLNGVARTWFPLAKETRKDDGSTAEPIPVNKQQALRLIEPLSPHSGDGILVGGKLCPVRPGDAVAFYNYLDDGSGRIDWRAIHAGLPVEGEQSSGSAGGGVEKWIANHWFRWESLAQTE